MFLCYFFFFFDLIFFFFFFFFAKPKGKWSLTKCVQKSLSATTAYAAQLSAVSDDRNVFSHWDHAE